jgi:hypothetical protein
MEVAVQVRLVASHWVLFYFVDTRSCLNSLHEFPIHMERCHRATFDRWNLRGPKVSILVRS